MKKFSLILVCLWIVTGLARIYSGPVLWLRLLNTPEKILLPVFCALTYFTLWHALSLLGGKMFFRKKGERIPGELFLPLWFVLFVEIYWFARNNVLPAATAESMLKIGFMAGLFFASAFLSIIVSYAVAALFKARERSCGFGGAGWLMATVTAVLTVYIFVINFWSFNLFAPKTIAPENAKSPNVVIMTIDTLSANYTQMFGGKYENTPNMIRIAKNGAMFEKNYVHTTHTAPSHSTIMTGLMHRTHGMLENDYIMLDDKYTTLAEFLSERGYETAQFMNVFLCGPESGLHQGFASSFLEYDTNSPFKVALGKPAIFALSYRALLRLEKSVFGSEPHMENYPLVRRWLELRKGKPFFLWFHSFTPHIPYLPGTEALKAIGASPDTVGVTSVDISVVFGDKIELSPERVEEMKTAYSAEIYNADRELSALYGDLERLGLLENTLFVVTSDHGEAIYKSDYFIGHGHQTYDDITHVPMVMLYPGKIAPGTVVSEPVMPFDIFPTIASFLGYELPGKVDGRNLLPVITGDDASLEPLKIVTEASPASPEVHNISIYSGDLHLIYNLSNEKKNMFFNTGVDGQEEQNRFSEDEYSSDIESMTEEIMEWETEYPLRYSDQTTEKSSEKIEKLKNLGYLR